MPRIGRSEFTAIYSAFRRVEANELSERDAGNLLVAQHGMNFSSAMGYLRCLRNATGGKDYTRTMSANATDYFLGRIRDDMSKEVFERTLAAVERHIVYYEAKAKTSMPQLRAVVANQKQSGNADASLVEFNEQFDQELERARQRPRKERLKRLKRAQKKPSRFTVRASVFQRNADVVIEVLRKANGRCQACKSPAPFNRKKDGSPYLEVHHKITLADGGEDTVENAEALCPNCHRQKHFG